MSDFTLPTPPVVCQAFPDPIPGVIPFGSVNLFAGPSGSGKTIMQTEWIQRWREGKSIWYHQTNRPTGFGFIAADRDWSTYQAAFDNARIASVPNYCLADDPDLNIPNFSKQTAFYRLSMCLQKLNPAPGWLVFIEPLAPLFIQGDQNRADSVAWSLHHIRREAARLQITIIGSANMGKLKVDEGYVRPQDRIAGSGAFVAYSDTQLYLFQGESKTDPHTFGWTPRRAGAEEFKVRFNPTSRLFEPEKGLLPVAPAPTELTTEERRQALLGLIPIDAPITRHELESIAMELFQVSRATIGRDLEKLIDQGSVTQPEHGSFLRRLPS